MKLAYIISAGRGLESFVYREIEGLNKLGWEVVLFATKYVAGDTYSPKACWTCYKPNLFLAVIRAIGNSFKFGLIFEAIKYKSLTELILAFQYAPEVNKHGITHLHAHFGDRKLFVAYFVSKLTNTSLSVTIHSHELHNNPNASFFRHVIKKVDRFLCISALAQDLLVNRFGAPKDKTEILHLFVDPKDFYPKPKFTVLTVCRFEPQKGLKYLLEAAALLKDQDIQFIIVGWGPEPVAQQVQEMGLNSKVTIFPKLDTDQLRVLYQSADVYCLPSISHPEQGMEGIPVVLMEALSCGLPVIATNKGAVSEIVAEVLVPEKDSLALSQAIDSLSKQSELQEKLSQNGIDKVSKDFSTDNLRQLSGIFQKMI